MKQFLCKIKSKLQKISQKHIRISVHPIVFVILIATIFLGLFWLFVIYAVSLLFHELCHAIVAKKLGYRADKIVVYPTGALLFGETDEFSFKDEIVVALAGPLSNIMIVVLLLGLWWIFPDLYNYSSDLLTANLSLALFNLLPVFPLDGGRVLLACLSSKYDRKLACKIAKTIALVFSVCLMIYFIVSLFFEINMQIGFMSVVLFVSSIQENKELVIKRIAKTEIKRKKLVKGLRQITLVFSADATLKNVFDKIDNFAIYKIAICDENFNQIAVFDEEQIIQMNLDFDRHQKIGNVIRKFI